MSTRPATSNRARSRPTTRRRARRSSRVARLRRAGLLLGATALVAVIAAAVMPPMLDKAAEEIVLPLRHEDIIRQQAADKRLDPSLIAGVIYAESRFVDQTSHAGAKGLMQLMPETADYIARKSGGVRFEQGDLATPQINIAYGSWYLRYLLDHYGGSEALALAAYNAGEGKVDEWLARHGSDFSLERIPFPETRSYVANVLAARDEYRRHYARELGLT
jgi:soluble lytic murein transglycosylase